MLEPGDLMQPSLPVHPHAAAGAAPTMSDVFGAYAHVAPGALSATVEAQLQSHAPLVPQQVHGFDDELRMRPLPYRDAPAWHLLKHGVQLALVASVVLFVVQGGRAPLMAFGYVGTALLLMVAIVVADRQRFQDRDPAFEILEVLVPEPRPLPTREMRPAPLVPLVEQMQVAMVDRVDVT